MNAAGDSQSDLFLLQGHILKYYLRLNLLDYVNSVHQNFWETQRFIVISNPGPYLVKIILTLCSFIDFISNICITDACVIFDLTAHKFDVIGLIIQSCYTLLMLHIRININASYCSMVRMIRNIFMNRLKCKKYVYMHGDILNILFNLNK